MKYGLFGVGLTAVLLSATGAGAEGLAFADTAYPNPAEALRNKAAVPEECLDAAGANTCIGLLIAEGGPEVLHWRFTWATPDTNAICVDSATADFRVDCDASDAVRIMWEHMMMVCGPNRTNCHKPPMPELPYRPTRH
ncbi:MAG TPA: hypothetical protein VN018_07425 [Brevundimonas sp.]|nr:hypothetical protein [Brevundimonas sp.]